MRMVLSIWVGFALCGSTLSATTDLFTSEPVRTLTESPPVLENWFGQAIATHGTDILISNIGAMPGNAAFLFEGDSGTLLHTFDNPAGNSSFNEFGNAVALSDDYVFVGASAAQHVEPGAGQVYRFDRHAGGGSGTSYFSPSPGASNAFGLALSTGHGYLFVGESGANDRRGAVHVYDLQTGSTTPVTSLSHEDPAAGDELGYALAVVGDVLAVGARFDGDVVTEGGAVYLFEIGSWVKLGALRSVSPVENERVGSSVAGAGLSIVVGAPLYGTPGGSRPGAVYLFDGDPSSTEFRHQLARFDNPSPDNLDRFGQSVAGVGSRFVVGAPWDSTPETKVGRAYLFDPADSDPVQVFENPDASAVDWFGWPVGELGGSLVISASHGNPAGVHQAGVVYVYGNTPAGSSVESVASSNDGTEVVLTFDEISLPGITTVEPVECPTLPDGSTFELCDPPVCQDISTTAIYDTEDGRKILVCVGYGASGCPTSGPDEPNIRLFHDIDDDGDLEDITTTVDSENDRVCGETTHLSAFEAVISLPCGSFDDRSTYGRLLFEPRCARDASELEDDLFDATTVKIHNGPEDAFYLSGSGVGFEPLIVDEAMFCDGEDVGLGPYASQPAPPATIDAMPIRLHLVPAPAHEITDLLPAGTNPIRFELFDFEREIYGNTAVYLVRDCGIYLDGSNDTTLNWLSHDVEVSGVPSDLDVVTGQLSQLREDGDFTRSCDLGTFTNTTRVVDGRVRPRPGEGFYYLVNGPCAQDGRREYASMTPDPRAGLWFSRVAPCE